MKKYKVTDYEILEPGASNWIRFRKRFTKWGWLFILIAIIRAFTI